MIVWGMCSWSDMEHLMRLDTVLVDDTYVNILPDHIFLSTVPCNGLEEFLKAFHTSRIIEGLLLEHYSDFKHLRITRISPGVNIIEHIWDAMQHAVWKRYLRTLTLRNLWIAVQK